jgi:hypothetical protein
MGNTNADEGVKNAHDDRATVTATVRSNGAVGLAMVTTAVVDSLLLFELVGGLHAP